MICKLFRGEDPAGLMKYFFDRECFQKVFDQNAKTYPEYAEMFKEHNELRADIKRPMYHIVVRLEPGIRPSDEEFSDLSHKLIEGMGLGFDRPYVMVKHDNERGDPGIHFHIATSRIDNSGNVWYGRNDAKLAIELSRELGDPDNFKEKDADFIPRVWSTGPSIRPRQTAREAKMLERTGQWSHKEHIALSLSQVLRSLPRDGQAPLNKDFMDGCAECGITPKIYTRANGNKGLIYEYKGMNIPASKIGRDYTLKGLSNYFNTPARGKDSQEAEESFTTLPKARKQALKNHLDQVLYEEKPKYKETPQPLKETDNIYEMVRDLKGCEFNDLQVVGESVSLQLDFKIVSKDTMPILTVYVRMLHGELQGRRALAKSLKFKKDSFVILKPEDIEGTDEHFIKHVKPARWKGLDYLDYHRHARRESAIALFDGMEHQYKGVTYFKNLHVDLTKVKHSQEERKDALRALEKQAEEFNKRPTIIKVLGKKPKAVEVPEALPVPKVDADKVDEYLDNDEFHPERQKWQKELISRIHKNREKMGMPVYREDVARLEREKNPPAPVLPVETPQEVVTEFIVIDPILEPRAPAENLPPAVKSAPVKAPVRTRVRKPSKSREIDR
jgi:hypothetical protein